MTQISRAFEAMEKNEEEQLEREKRLLGEQIMTEKPIQEEDKELEEIKAIFKSSAEKGEKFLEEHGLTEEKVMKGKRIPK